MAVRAAREVPASGSTEEAAERLEHGVMAGADGDEVLLIESEVGALLDGEDVVRVERTAAASSREAADDAAARAGEEARRERAPLGTVVGEGHEASPPTLSP
jgi:hypothetical protein